MTFHLWSFGPECPLRSVLLCPERKIPRGGRETVSEAHVTLPR